MTEEQLKKFKKRLELTREEAIKVIAWQGGSSEGREGQDEIDQANELIEREMGSLMTSNMNANLREVNEALLRIEKHHYGKCLHCGEEISLKRLEFLPSVRYCVACQAKMESRSR